MRNAVIISLSVLLSGCGAMDYEEYQSRVKYCESLNLVPYTYESISGAKDVNTVVCKTSDGRLTFASKRFEKGNK